MEKSDGRLEQNLFTFLGEQGKIWMQILPKWTFKGEQNDEMGWAWDPSKNILDRKKGLLNEQGLVCYGTDWGREVGRGHSRRQVEEINRVWLVRSPKLRTSSFLRREQWYGSHVRDNGRRRESSKRRPCQQVTSVVCMNCFSPESWPRVGGISETGIPVHSTRFY